MYIVIKIIFCIVLLHGNIITHTTFHDVQRWVPMNYKEVDYM